MKFDAQPSVLSSLRKGIAIQLHPRMLFAIFIPFVVFIVSSIVLLSSSWDKLSHWLLATALQWPWFQTMQSSLMDWGMSVVSNFAASTISIITLLAIALIIGLTTAAIIVTPLAVKFISAQYFPHLQRHGEHVNSVSILNAVKVSVIFIMGWLVTLPLWVFPIMSIVLPIFWAAYAFSHMAQVDAIVDHANKQEREYILTTHKRGFWAIGLVCALLSLIPFVGFVMPVFSIIVCTHYGLQALDNHRRIKSLPK